MFLAGREELLTGLDGALDAGRAAGVGPGVVVLCGMGGAGKTSVAVEYAYRQAAELGVVWQLPAEDPAGGAWLVMKNSLGINGFLGQPDSPSNQNRPDKSRP